MWNDEIIERLKEGCIEKLKECGVRDADIFELQTSGSYELPHTAACIIEKYSVDAVVCIGCLIKGETYHFEYICEAVTQGIMRINLDTGVPCLFGVLTVKTKEQAEARAGIKPGSGNHGEEWAESAVLQAKHRRDHQFKGLPSMTVKMLPNKPAAKKTTAKKTPKKTPKKASVKKSIKKVTLAAKKKTTKK
jgi:6,7-dimethyl-8-ribityllumazine synthase